METTTETAPTFELEVSRTVKEIKHVALPHFRKTNCHAYKVFSPQQCIQVHYADMKYENGGARIEIAPAQLAWNINEGQECTKEEFEEIYEQTEMYLRSKVFNL